MSKLELIIGNKNFQVQSIKASPFDIDKKKGFPIEQFQCGHGATAGESASKSQTREEKITACKLSHAEQCDQLSSDERP